jgi:hypothetical protein
MSFTTFTSRVSYLSPADEAMENDFTFTVGVTYSHPGSTAKVIEVGRFISETMFSEDYVPYGSPVPMKFFEKVKELIVTTEPDYITFTDQINDVELRKEIFKTKTRYVAYAVFNKDSSAFSHTPYVVTSFSESGVGAFSSSTQVLHNVLHLENENIWWCKPTGYNLNLSEISQDWLRSYLNRHHVGVDGIGGLAWVVNAPDDSSSSLSFSSISSSSSSQT